MKINVRQSVLLPLVVKQILYIMFMKYEILYNPYGHHQVPSSADSYELCVFPPNPQIFVS
jgi:hypothetical protein